MTMNFEFDVFLSYNAWDGELVQDLADRLIDAGLRVWMDRSEVHAGESWTILSNEALVQSRVLVLCLSPNTFASGWVDMERNTTLHRGLSNDGRRFVPLLLSDCELPESLRRYTYVDYRERSDSAFNELLTQI
ncbi:MAG TPA: toll/interleukin-1 receptor domain-containing protein, partial [Puia sp.]